jgi:hypothetical protein
MTCLQVVLLFAKYADLKDQDSREPSPEDSASVYFKRKEKNLSGVNEKNLYR